MSLRFYNARILKTVGREFEIVKGELHTDGKLISKIIEGESKGSDEVFEREIDCKNNLIIPGFKNCHAHSAMTFLRSYADDLPLQEWLFNSIFPKEDLLVVDDIYWLTMLGFLEYLSSGITGVMDMYFFQHNVARAAKDAGFRVTQTITINNFGPPLEVIKDRFEKVIASGELNKNVFGIHAEYTTSRELTEKIIEMAHEYKSPFFSHISETEHEVKECKERHGKTPVQYFDELDAYKYGGGGYHCNFFEDSDFEIYKEKGLFAVTNPASNLKLASGICPVTRFLKEGINLAIGTDGPASNNALDFFREMYLAATLAKVREMDASVVSASDILYSATNVGAHCLGVPEADCLEEGKLADLVILDMNMPNMQPEHNIPKNIVYAGSKANVKLTMINGKILFEDGEYNIGYEPAEIYARTNEIINRMGF